MKKMLRMLVALATFGGLAHGTVFIETGFEGSTSLPAGWAQSIVTGSATWKVQTGGDAGGGSPSTARSGTNNATLYVTNAVENKSRLTSPTFDTVGYTNLSLTFWHTQALWSPDQDELKVFFSSDGGTNWTQLAYYTTSVSAWTQRTLVIPSASANSRIMFEGNARYGHGVCLDDIQVTGIPGSISEVSVSATDAAASEVAQDPGTWTITRIGNTTGAVSVNFTLSGTATISSDYNAAPASPINFAAGETSKIVTLTPADDMVGSEGNEVATLTLTTGTGYAIGTASGNISIYDDEGYDLNILVIGSTHSFSEGGESGVVHEKPFNPTTIASHLYQIIDQDPAISGSANVQFEDIYKTKAQTVNYSGTSVHDFTSHCYSLAQHYMWPDGKTNRLANLRGQAGTQWDYIIICNDPYIMANFPGMVAEGVKLIKQEVAKSPNPAQVVLLAQWPETSSTFTANQFNEIAYRVGNSAGLTVVPAGKAWDGYGSKDTSSNHPTPRGEYLAAASIYSKLYNRSAKTSAYVYPTVGSAIADHALSVVQANNGVAQYSGAYTSFNPFQMKYLAKRVVSYRETGTSTEDRLSQALDRLDDVQRITFNTSGYAGVPGTRWDFNYGRGNDWWEDDKDYEVNSTIYDWVYGFPMHHYSTTSAPNTMPYGIDKHYDNGTTYEDGTDLGIPYNMIRPNTREPDWPEAVRAIPIRLMWQKMCELAPGFNPLGDSTHMNPNLNDASAAFMYTLLSGRCPIVVEPTPQGSANPAWMQWLGHKTGYETAWQMSHLTTRAPGFRVQPSARTTTTITPTTKETMTVEFANPPQSDVTVNVSISNANAAVLGSRQLLFTPQNYNIPQSVSVAGLPGSAASETFNVVFTTVSTDEIYNGLSDTWDYTITRSAPATLTRVDKGTTQVNANQNLPVTINLNTAGASSSNTTLAGPSRGTTTWSGADVIYTPSSDFTGKDGFSFASNNAGTLSVGYIEITVSSAVPNGKVSYRGNGSDGGTVPIDSATYAQSATVTVLGNTGNLIRTGYNFNGWNTSANGSGSSYNAGGTFTMGASGAILYAQWISAPTYTVSYNGNANSGGFAPSSQIKTSGVDLTLATNSGGLVRTGYTFAGWNTAANGTGTDYTAGVTYSGNANLPLFAKWTANNYTVTFNANGGDTPSPTSKSVTYGTPYGTLATISRAAYTFNGWYTLASGGSLIQASTNVNITGNQTLYAQWTAITSSTVSYNGNGSESGTVPADQSKLIDIPLVLETNSGGLTRSGFTFAGWNTAADGSGTAYAAGGNYTANAAVVLYAQWAGSATYTVSYNGNGSDGGTAPASQTKTQGLALPLATNSGNLTKAGYGFAGWNTAENGGGTAYAAGAPYITDSAITLYAQWNDLPVVNAGADQTVVLNGTPWSPSLLTPQLWLDADDGNTITLNGATVSEWRDKSGNVRHASQTTATSQPTRTAAALNGKTVLTFDGTADFLNLGTGLDFLAGVSHSAFIVTKPTSFNNLYGAANASAGANSLHVGFASATNYRMNYWANDYGPVVTTNFVAGSANIMNYVWTSGTSKQILANGKSEGTNASAGVIGTMSGGGRIGNIVGHGYIGGDIAEMVFLTGTVSAADRESMEGHLAHKWGLTANLAANHPYKNTPPGGSGAVVTLDGTATDADTLTYTWSVITGPASVTFTNPAAIDTSATFTVAGVYTLQLMVDDGCNQVSRNIVVTVYAAGSGNSVTYSGNGSTGGSVPVDASSPYANGSTVTVLGNTGSLVRTGYTFNGWNTQADGLGTSYAPAATFAISTPTTLYAKWTINSYTITFDSAGGSAVTAITQNYGTTVNAPANPTRSGYTFSGWSPSLPATMPANSQTVTAQWTTTNYSVTYSGNGNTGGAVPTDASSPYTIGATVTVLGNTGTLVRSGYTFNGWNTQADGLGTSYASGNTFAISSATTLYANWTINSYTITFDSAGGSAITSINQNFGTTINAPANPTRSGYTFTAWSPVVPATMPANNLTVTAQWTINTYAVTYNGNGNTGGTAPSEQTKTYDLNVTLSGVGTLTQNGHSFIGWNTAADGTGTDYAANAIYSTNAPLALFAKWDRIPTVVALNPSNGATGASPTGNLTITFSENIAFGAGAITLRQSNGTLVESFNVANPPSGLTLSGATVTLNPAFDLAVGITYYVEIDANAIDDLAGNSFAGFSGNGTWSFTILPQILADSYLTGLDVAAPVPLYSSLNFPSILDGPLTGSSTLTHAGYFGSQLSFVGNSGNAFTGNLTVDSGTLRIAGSPFASNGGFVAGSMTSSDTITINRAGTLLIDDTVTGGYTANRFGTGASSARPAVNLAGGRLNLTGLNNASSSVQTFGDLTASSGYSIITNTRSAGNPTLTFDSLSISSGAILNFYSATLGTGTDDARITFTNAPTMINGIIAGAKVWNPATAGVGDFATYDTNGVKVFTAYDVVSNDINTGTSSTTNFAMTVATTPVTLTTDRSVNSLNYRANGGTWSLGGYKLTLTSGMFLRNGTNTALTINNGTLTAGNGTDAIDLHIFTAQQNMTIDALIANNAASAVTLVKSHGNSLTVSGTANNTYTGGTYVVDGTLATGSTAGRAYLGTGKVTVNNALLTLGSYGATSNSSGDDYTVVNGGQIAIASGTAGAYTASDTFYIGANSLISGNSASGQGLASLTRGTNITLAADAIIGHDYSLTTALNLTTGTIKNLGTNADLYYGFKGSTNQVSTSAVINIGTGTAFKGLSLFGGSGTFDGGTINVASGTTDVYIKTNGADTVAPVTFTLGYDFFAGTPKITLVDASTVDVNALGLVNFRDPLATFGDTSTNRNVVFVATAGSNLQFLSAATGMGSGTGIASARIENGGSITTTTSADALNGAVTVQAGGRFDAALAGGVTGSGQLTFEVGSILNVTNATGFSGAQATAASIAAGTIVKLSAGNFGAVGTTLDSVLDSGSKSVTYLVVGNQAAIPTLSSALYTLNKSSGGVGGVLTNDLSARTVNNLTTGNITLGANGGVIAATTGTTFTIAENITGAGSLTAGSTAIIDGAPKLGTVSLTATTNDYSGGTTVNAGTLTMGAAYTVLGSNTGLLTVNGGTMNMAGNSLTVGNLTGTGGVISGTSNNRILTIGQGDFGGGDYQGSIQNGAGGTTALTKTGTGTITLSGANTYTGATAINVGTLFINGDQTSATGAVSVAANATLGGTGTLGGSSTIAVGGKLEFNLSTIAGSHDKLELAATKTLAFSGASTLTITSSGGASPGLYTLVTAPGGISGSLPTLSLPANWAATVSISGNNLLLNVTSTGATYTITYDSNSATSGSIPAAQTKTQDVSLTLQNNSGTLARTGYTFSGWNTQANGEGTSYAEGDSYTTNTARTLYAKWTMLPYTAWASGTFANTFTDTALTSNPDGDNLTNLQEFAFGMDPTSPALAPLSYVANGTTVAGTPVLEKVGATYRAVFVRRKNHISAGLAYTVLFSADLTSWTTAGTSPVRLSGDNADPIETMAIDFPTSVPLQGGGSAAPKFFRVAVTGN